MNILVIVAQIVTLFLILFVGLFVGKIKILPDNSPKTISKLVLYVSLPAMIISSMSDSINVEISKIFIIAGLSIVIHAFLFLTTFIIPKILKVEKKNVGTYKFMTMFSNVGYMGYPVLISILGADSLFYAAIFNIPNGILVFSIGIYLMGEGMGEFNFKKLLNPGIISALFGLVLFFTNIKIPPVLFSSLEMVGNMTTPLSMILIGLSLSTVEVTKIFSNIKIYILIVFKQIIIPLIVFMFLMMFGIDPYLIKIMVIIIAMPVAANTVIVSQEYGGNTVLASETVFLSTLLSLITIPVFVSLII